MSEEEFERLTLLIKEVRKIPITDERKRSFRISSVYGSAKLSNPNITLEDVIRAEKKLRERYLDL